jgi:inosose dehydratase
VPGWGTILPADRVLGEMAALGFDATELGPLGYLPLEGPGLKEVLGRHGLGLVSGFVPLVLHEPSLDAARVTAERVAAVLAECGAEVFVAAAVMDEEWSQPVELDASQWGLLLRHLAEIDELVSGRGLRMALHPHAGTLLEQAADVERALAESDVGWCLDTGHLMIGGADPVEFARRHSGRVVHVHLKDLDMRLAERLRRGELSLVEAVREGLFRPLGRGDAEIAEVIRALAKSGYDGWFVLEQDTAITGEEPPVGSGPVVDVRASVEYLDKLAPAIEEVSQT